MARPRPPHLQRHKTRHGKFVWYVQIGSGPLIRIRSEFGTADFDEEYQVAVAQAPTRVTSKGKSRPTGSLDWAWMLYRQSAAWVALSPATRRQRENIMLNVLKNGNPPLSQVTKAAINAGIDRRRDTPAQVRNFLQTMRTLFVWLVENEIVANDPTFGMRARAKKSRAGFPIWTAEDVIAYENRWPIGTRQRVMLDVFLYTGLRRGDAARVGPGHVRNNTISLVTEKTETEVYIPVLQVLRRTLDAGPTGKLSFICKPDGLPYVKESLGNAFKEACIEAGVLGKSAHGLRKVAATRAADNGATASELMAIFGWSNIREAEVYTRNFDRARLARQAMSKLER